MPPVRSQRTGLLGLLLGLTVALGLFVSASAAGLEVGHHAAAGDSLTIALTSEPKSLDPMLIDDGYRDYFTWSVYEGLTARTAGGRTVPALASSWSNSNGGKTWIFTLRKGVKFSDGTPLTSADVVASYQHMLNPDNGSSIVGQLLPDPKTKVAEDGPDKVSITTSDVQPLLPANASLIAIASASLANAGKNGMYEKMVGTGPYKLVAWDHSQDIKLAANPLYRGPQPKISDVTFRFIENANARLAALQTGEIQVATAMPPALISKAPKVVSVSTSEIHVIILNELNKYLKDRRLRLAANLAIDRKTLIAKLWRGFAKPAQGQTAGQYVFGTDPTLKDYPFNPRRARQLVSDYVKDHGPLKPLVMLAQSGRWTSDRQVAEAETQMLTNVGFKIKLSIPAYADFAPAFAVLPQAKKPAGPAMLSMNVSSLSFDSSEQFTKFFITNGAIGLTTNKRVNALIATADSVTNSTVRQKLLRNIWHVVYKDMPYVAIADVQAIHFTSKNLTWGTKRNDGFLSLAQMQYTS
jgi:peptide/nickel transport system substrate-binding protein